MEGGNRGRVEYRKLPNPFLPRPEGPPAGDGVGGAAFLTLPTPKPSPRVHEPRPDQFCFGEENRK